MSRTAVREAIAAYLEDADIDYLGVISPHPPKLTPEGELMADPKYHSHKPGVNVGVAVFIRLGDSTVRQIAIGGEPTTGGPNGGRKWKDYVVTFDAILLSSKPTAEEAGEANDDFLDAFEVAIMSNRTADSAGAIFQWGMGGAAGGTDIRIESYYPTLVNSRGDSNITQVISRITVTACEVLDY